MTVRCPWCRHVGGPEDGPTHAYIGASPGCWATFGEALAMAPWPGDLGTVLTDAYAAQHPGRPERRAVQSVAVHLVVLCAAVERGAGPDALMALRRGAVALGAGHWRRLDVTAPVGTTTVADVVDGGVSADGYVRDVWVAYGERHDAVRGWLDAVSG